MAPASTRSLAQHRSQARVRERNVRICIGGLFVGAAVLAVALVRGWHWLVIAVAGGMVLNFGVQLLGELGRLDRHRKALRDAGSS